ncbi:hypothetical protein LTR56_026545 [Elasticomyces elasticus]|nr:hypothetical protein LTR56_026545 [Elasticomyces elasticus]KAK3634548.1 hypothetical protein LTR22_019578 [Elasticomyces elasticus]KAK4917101.1 hypothetical protein LTR49_015004 [Elasticomyces elasticus]KAK5743760.1 hypothetical protein LTS12_023709 [Elasticomyces elasticus]
MTGYQAIATAIVTPSGGTDFVTVSTAVIAPIIVHDGSRLGYQDDYAVTKSDPNYLTLSSYMNLTTGNSVPMQASYVLSSTETISTSNVTIRNQTGSFNSLLLPLPYLNITAHEDLKDPVTRVDIGGTTILYKYLVGNATCLPSQKYKWGFSSILLFTFCLASLLFLTVLQAMAWRLYEHSRSDRLRRPVNSYQDALDIVQELGNYFEHSIRDLDLSTVKRDELRERQAVIVLDTAGLPESRHTERQGESRGEEIYSAFSYDLPYQWYRRLAKVMNSHWADEDVIVYWPAKRKDDVAKGEQAEDKRGLAAEVASMAAQSEAADVFAWTDEESIALRSLNRRASFEEDR